MPKGNELILYGSVGYDWWGDDYFTAKMVRDQLAGMSGDITVRINSGGGIASEGQAIYTALIDYPGKVTVMVDGVAASAASLISMAGDEIIYRLGAWTLIHDPATPWTLGRGTEEDHRKEAELLGVISNAYADIYAASSGLSREECRAVMKAETVLDGAMAVEMGFATSVDTVEKAVPEAAFDYRIYANAPEHLRKASRKLGRAPAEEAVMAMIAGRPRTPTKKEPTMAVKKQTAAGATLAVNEIEEDGDVITTPVVATPAVEASAPGAATASAAERTRARRIMDAAAVAGLPLADITALVDSNKTVEQALDDITAKWKEKGDVDTPMTGRPTMHITRDETDTRREGMADAIAAQMRRSDPTIDAAKPYMSMTLAEMAADIVGRKSPMRAADVAQVVEMSMHSTSDFPGILENALNKRLQDGYSNAVPTYQEISQQYDFQDFRPHPVSAVGEFQPLAEIREGGEIQFGTVGEKKESVQLRSFANGLSFSRQMIINDDLRAIDRVISTVGASVARFEDSVFYGMFLSGTLADGPTLLETGRQVFNINAADNTKAAASSAITVASVSAARAALMVRKGVASAAGKTDGQFLALTGAVLLVGPLKQTEAEQLVSPINAALVGNVNPFAGKLRVVVTPFIQDNAWYMFSDPAVLANFVFGFCGGLPGRVFVWTKHLAIRVCATLLSMISVVVQWVTALVGKTQAHNCHRGFGV